MLSEALTHSPVGRRGRSKTYNWFRGDRWANCSPKSWPRRSPRQGSPSGDPRLLGKTRSSPCSSQVSHSSRGVGYSRLAPASPQHSRSTWRTGTTSPRSRFSVSKEEPAWPRKRAAETSTNPGSMLQRVEWAFAGEPAPQLFVAQTGNRNFRSSLAPSAARVPRAGGPATQGDRRVYRELPSADVVVVTLGLVEAWFDSQTGYWLNRMPPRPALCTESKGRYRLRVMGRQRGLPDA